MRAGLVRSLGDQAARRVHARALSRRSAAADRGVPVVPGASQGKRPSRSRVHDGGRGRDGCRDQHAGARGLSPIAAPVARLAVPGAADRNRGLRVRTRAAGLGTRQRTARRGQRRARGPIAPLHRRGHVALHRLLPLRAHLRRRARAAGLARPRARRRHAHRAGRSGPARELLRELRRLRGYVSDRGARRRRRSRSGRRVPVDTDDVPVLRRRLRDARGHGRQPNRVRSAGTRRAGQPGTFVREGPVCLRLRGRRGSNHTADDSRAQRLAGGLVDGGDRRRGEPAAGARRAVRAGQCRRAGLRARDERRQLRDAETRPSGRRGAIPSCSSPAARCTSSTRAP
jgi:hypothetical protein